ncbi:MAG: hypothetical protein HYZ29_32185 [Myxococcales bacterium]|nr:hypothetical protein [Myxococcales bacterium]
MNRNDELERPGEWLRHLNEDPSAFGELVSSSENLAVAAFRLARARCRVQSVPTSTPTQSELGRAAADLARHAEVAGSRLAHDLVRECERAGLLVLAPIRAA